jgi:polyisoprenoid-binding protein YceI
MGNVSGGSAPPSAITPTQVKTMLGYRSESEVAAAIAAYSQPLDSDLTSIAALSTASFGRSFLVLANAGAGRSLLELSAIATSGSASDLTSGTVPNARLSSQVARTDLENTFSQTVRAASLVGISTGGADSAQMRADGFINRISGHTGIHFSVNHLNVGDASGEIARFTGAGNLVLAPSSVQWDGASRLQVEGSIGAAGTVRSSSALSATGTGGADSAQMRGDGFLNRISGHTGIRFSIDHLNVGDVAGEIARFANLGSLILGASDFSWDGSSRLQVSGKISASGSGKLGDFTVATLPSASANPGHEANATDSSVTTFGSTVAGGGSSRVKVYSNGTNWTVQAA